jgi:hypothetical protein
MYRRLWLASICAVALTASACGRDTADTGAAGTATGTGTGTTTGAPTAALTVDEIRTGKTIGADNRVVDETNEFAPNETIYASVRTAGSAPSATLVAKWTFQDGQVVSEDSRTIAPNGAAVTEFHISQPAGLPKGNYKLEVTMDGRSVGTKDFEVK